jgi:hypothetical protein
VRLRGIAVEAGPESSRPAAPPPSHRRKTVDDPADPLVAEVGRVFGVGTWSVQELLTAVIENEDEAES